MSGYRVILDVGLTGKEVDFPEANCWANYKGSISIGDGTTNSIGKFEGDRHGWFDSDDVAGIVDL